MVWLIILSISVIATVVTIKPLLGASKAKKDDRQSLETQFYLQQLDQIDYEAGQGVITLEEAESAKVEVSRRLLTLSTNTAEIGEEQNPRQKFTAFYLALVIPSASVALYLIIGSPHMADPTYLETSKLLNTENKALAAISRLGETVKNQPNNFEGWKLYAKGLTAVKKFDEAIPAWRRVLFLRPNDPELYAVYAETIIASEGGLITEAARKAIEKSLILDSRQPRARYYAGLAASQSGNPEMALKIWIDLLKESQSDAPWILLLEKQIAKITRDAGISQKRLKELGTLVGP
jgi:cytochrome c-type biogenesis protein CcmH